MKRLAIVAALSISGCALTPAELYSLSNYDLCMNYLTKPASVYRQQVIGELQRRGENCSAYANLAAARIQADAANDRASAAIIRSTMPPPAQQTTCQAFQTGQYTTMTCR